LQPIWDAAAGAKSDAEAKTAYAALDKIYRENVPVVPLMYRPLEFYEFNASNWRTSDRREPIRSPHVAGRRHPVAIQDQEGRNLMSHLS
jgi:ABC-type oligopeptide transport system substrate-binding subunit